MRMVLRQTYEDQHLKAVKELANEVPNKKCFDCGQKGPVYVNLTVGSFVCMSCSGLLRGLNPPHRIKSISMSSFTKEEVDILKSNGNLLCEKKWLGTYHLSNSQKKCHKELKMDDHLIQKYEKKLWYREAIGSSPNKIHESGKDESKESLKRKETDQVMNGLKNCDKSFENVLGSSDGENRSTQKPSSKAPSFDEIETEKRSDEYSMDLARYLGNDPFVKYDKYAPLAELDKTKGKASRNSTDLESSNSHSVSPCNPFQYMCHHLGNTNINNSPNFSCQGQNMINPVYDQVYGSISGVPSQPGILPTDSPRFSWYDRILNKANSSTNSIYFESEPCQVSPYNASQLPTNTRCDYQNVYGQEPVSQPLPSHSNFITHPELSLYQVIPSSQQYKEVKLNSTSNNSRNPFASDVMTDKENIFSPTINTNLSDPTQNGMSYCILSEAQFDQNVKSKNPFIE